MSKITRYAVSIAADAIMDSVVYDNCYITAHFGFMHEAAERFGLKPFTPRSFNVGQRIAMSVYTRYGQAFEDCNNHNFQNFHWDEHLNDLEEYERSIDDAKRALYEEIDELYETGVFSGIGK